MSIIYQNPLFLSLSEFRQLTGWSIRKIADETMISEATLHRYKKKPAEEYLPQAKLFALIYKNLNI